MSITTERPTIATDLPLYRLHLMRAGYLLMGLGLAVVKVISDWKVDDAHRRRHSASATRPSGLRCSPAPTDERPLSGSAYRREVCRSGSRFQRGWVLAIRLEPVGRLVRHLRHVRGSGVAVSYCGRPVGR
jgi:hypothetical protein